MPNEEHSHTNSPQPARVPRGLSLEEAHIMRQHNSIITLQQSVRQISRQLEQMATHFSLTFNVMDTLLNRVSMKMRMITLAILA